MKRIVALILVFIFIIPTVSYSNALDPYINGYMEGHIKGWFDGQLEIEEYDGTLHLIAVDENTIYEIDNRPALMDDFKTGMEVSAWLQGRRIQHILSYSTQNPGYIPEGGKVRNGIVKKIDRDQLVLKLPTGEEETYFTSSATISTKKGNTVSLDVLYVGDHVKLYFDQIDTQFINRIEIEGESVVIKEIYKGRISVIDRYSDNLTLADVEVFRNGKWEKTNRTLSLPFDLNTPIYSGGQRISYGSIQYYRGKTVYAAVKEYFGSNRIERMIVKSQSESLYNDKIEEINWYGEAFELSNKRNITFNEGTMVIKNGRLVDRYAINPKSDAFIAADGRNMAQMADLIYIYNEDINNSNIGQRSIYSARLDNILQDRVVTRELFQLDRNEWRSYSEGKEFYFDNDTVIYDVENGKQVTQEEFYSSEYSVDENSDSYTQYGKRDWYAYFYNDGDRITHVLLQKSLDSLLKLRITNGAIEEMENDPQVGWSFYLKNGSDWSSQKGKWMPRSVSTRMNVQNAMIIKNDKRISPEELLAGDRLYMVRDDFKVKVVLVK